MSKGVGDQQRFSGRDSNRKSGVKTGGRLLKHARYYPSADGLLAESYLTRRLFGSMVRRIEALPVSIG